MKDRKKRKWRKSEKISNFEYDYHVVTYNNKLLFMRRKRRRTFEEENKLF